MNKELDRVFKDAGYRFTLGMRVVFSTIKKEIKEGVISALFLTNKPPSVTVETQDNAIVIPTKRLLFVGKTVNFRNNKGRRSTGVIREIKLQEVIPVAKICFENETHDDRCLIVPIKDVIV